MTIKPWGLIFAPGTFDSAGFKKLLGMPVVRFISLLANGQSDTQWLPRHLHHHEDQYFVVFHDDDELFVVLGDDDEYVDVVDVDEEDEDDDHTCCTSNVEEVLHPQEMLSGPCI